MHDCPTPTKRHYRYKIGAIESAIALNKKDGRKLVPYHCPCGLWHLTTHKAHHGEWPTSDMRLVF